MTGLRCNRPDAWFFPPEKQTYQGEPTGQLTIFFAESDKPPDPDDYENLEAFEKAWEQWEQWQLDNSISAQELAQDFRRLDCNSALTSLDFAKTTNGAKIFCRSDSLESQSSQTCRNVTGDAPISDQTSSQPRLHANRLASKDNVSAEPTSATVSPQSSERSPSNSPNTSPLKMSEDSSPAQLSQDRLDYILVSSLKNFSASGTMQNGKLSAADTLPRPGLESDYCWLESPGALSCAGKGRPPGRSKLEAQLRKLGAIGRAEVANPEFLETAFNLPIGWSDPSETRSALELIQEMRQSGGGGKPSETL